MKILFIGSVYFSKKCLEKLIELQSNIVGVCTLKESPFNADFFDLSPICIKKDIPFQYADDINSKEQIDWIHFLSPDIIFCFGWSRLLKYDLLNIAPMGVLGYHPAKLPKNRGRHPIIWSLALGLRETASTFFFMDEGADSGDILCQNKIKISNKDDANTLYQKTINCALKQIDEFLPKLKMNKFNRIAQNKNESNIWRKRNEKDGQIDWRMSSESIYNLVRALTKPYVGAHFFFERKKIIVWKALSFKFLSKNIEPGKVLENKKNRLTVKTGDSAIILLKIEPIIQINSGIYL